MQDKILFIGTATGTFVLSIIIITVCYVKRWCCFMNRDDCPTEVTELGHEEEGRKFKRYLKWDVNHKFIKLPYFKKRNNKEES